MQQTQQVARGGWMYAPLLSVMVLMVGAVSVVMSAEDLPTPATIHMQDGTVHDGVFVIREGLREVSWSRDDRMQARTNRPASEVSRVEYSVPRNERDYQRGLGAFNSSNWSTAIDALGNAASNSRYAFVRLDAHMKRAHALMRLRRHDDAIAEINGVINDYGQWRQVIEAQEMLARIHLAADNVDGALAAYRGLRRAAGNYGTLNGAVATARGALGEARIHTDANNNDQALQVLRDAFANVPLAVAPAEHGAVAAALGQALVASEDLDAAQEIFRDLRFAGVPPTPRATALLELGKMEQAAGNRIAAVDYLVMAAVLRGTEDEVRSEARRRARALLNELGRDESIDALERREYRNYAANL
ncbi:MAG: hypothetical protein EA401_04880 [Planctomycetota bacterium]|nr:MAG: hypothetical protein EA401_04880 [Planctomycetota bacterium]